MWNIIRADEFCESVRDGTHDTPKPVENGFKLVTSKHILNGRVYPEDAYCISEKDFKKINERSKVDKWDVLMSMIGNGLGKSAIIDYTPDFAIKNIALFKIGNEAKAKWLHYFLSSNYAQNVILNYLQGTGQPFLSLNLIRGFKIWNPPNTILEKIVKILSCYDEAIENNNKRIKLLEQMAQNLYKEWFVRFRFPGYENCEFENGIPVGWNIQKLEDFGIVLESGSRPSGGVDINLEEGIPSLGAECIKGLAEFDYSNIKYIPLEFYEKMKRGKNKGIHILLYKDGAYIGKVTLFRNQFPFKKYAINEHVFFLNSKNDNYLNWLFFTLKQDSYFNLMQNLNRNAAQPGLSQLDICRIKLRIPQEDIVIKFNEFIEPLLTNVFNLSKANKNLAKQRDLLLPRLMSGKLEVR